MAARLTEEIMQSLPGYKHPEHRRCFMCREPMKPHINWRDRKPGEIGIKRFHTFMVPTEIAFYGYGREELFCTLRCAYKFACIKAKTMLE